MMGDHEKLKQVPRKLIYRPREYKVAYSKKLEEKLGRNNPKYVWSGMREITGLQRKGGLGVV